MADRAQGGKAAGTPDQRGQLRVAYGNALIGARGYGAPETAEAFEVARDSPKGDGVSPERFAADYGLFAASYVRGDLPSMRAKAAAFLKDVEDKCVSPEAGVAHRCAGLAHWIAGDYAEAREHLEKALALFQPGRDDDLAFRFGSDAGAGAMLYLAIVLWSLGAVDRAIFLVDGAESRIATVTHAGTRGHGKAHAGIFDRARFGSHRPHRGGSFALALDYLSASIRRRRRPGNDQDAILIVSRRSLGKLDLDSSCVSRRATRSNHSTPTRSSGRRSCARWSKSRVPAPQSFGKRIFAARRPEVAFEGRVRQNR
jgi:tetratricopeptide (TPR) repeat protein